MTPGSQDFEHYDYAIIGMGVGGLTLGALLAAAGKRVIIFEQHYAPGGYGHTFIERRYAFCAELHYVWDCGPGDRVYKMLEKLGLETKVTFRRLDPDGFDRVIGPSVDYTIGSGFDRELERLTVMFPDYGAGLRTYYGIIDALHHQLYDLPIGFSWGTLLRHPWRFSNIIRYADWTLERLFEKIGFPPELRLILAGQSAIFFMPPRDLSLVAHAGGVGSYNRGAYYPSHSYRQVMRSLLRKITDQPGCRSMLSTEITGIGTENGIAASVTTAAGDVYRADAIVMNGDAQESLDLIGREHFSRAQLRHLEYDYGPSVVSVYLGLRDIDLRKHGLGEQNIFWHPKVDLNEMYDGQFRSGIPERPYFFCNSPTLRQHEATLAPNGGSQLVIVSPCTYEYFAALRAESEDGYQEAKQQFADRLIAVVESELVPGLSDHIVVKAVGSPLTNESYVRAPMGNCYGSPLDPKHVRRRRLNHQSPFPNLHFVGASTGLPGFATVIHFASLLYEELTGDPVY
jgi:phytoene dehydrogenase-like protein